MKQKSKRTLVSEGKKISIYLDQELAEKIDDVHVKLRLSSDAETIRIALRKGLDILLKEME